MHYSLLLSLLLPLTSTASPVPQNGGKNAESIPLAIDQNRLFKTLAASSHCDATAQPNACIDDKFAQCVSGSFAPGTACSGGLKCFSLPLVNKVGTSVTCTTDTDAAARMGFDSVAKMEAAFGDAVSVSMAMLGARDHGELEVHINDHNEADESAHVEHAGHGAAGSAHTEVPATETAVPAETVPPTATVPPKKTVFPTGTALRNGTAGNGNGLSMPAKTNLPNGTAIPAETVLPTGTALPTESDIASESAQPTGTALPMPSGTELPAETELPSGTELPEAPPAETGNTEAQPPCSDVLPTETGAPEALPTDAMSTVLPTGTELPMPKETALPTGTALPMPEESALPTETGLPAGTAAPTAPPATSTAPHATPTAPHATATAPPATETALPNETALPTAPPATGTAPAGYGSSAGYGAGAY